MASQQQLAHDSPQPITEANEERNTSSRLSKAMLSTAMRSKAMRLRSATSVALSTAGRQLSRLIPAPKPNSALAHADCSLSLAAQLAIVTWVAVFVLYPSWVQTTLGIFACYVIDDGKGLYGENQKVSTHSLLVACLRRAWYMGAHARAPAKRHARLVSTMLPRTQHAHTRVVQATWPYGYWVRSC